MYGYLCCSTIGRVVQEAEKRARALSAQESEMAQARADIQHERERLAEEVDSRTRRSREECDYKVDLERYAVYIHVNTLTPESDHWFFK